MTLSLPGVDVLPPAAMRQVTLGQWDTPPWLAEHVAGELPLFDPPESRVLEPSAGVGNVVAALLARGVAQVVAVELDPGRCDHLRARFRGQPVSVIEGDFLDVAARERWSSEHFDGIAGNPPYDSGADTAHLAAIADIMHRGPLDVPASLLLRTVALHGQERGARVWSRVRARVMPVVERVAFGEEAGMIDVSVFVLKRGASSLHIRRPA